MHRGDVNHADIKQVNILVYGHDIVAKLCDMGLSRVKTNIAATMSNSCIPGILMYMSPEGLPQGIMPGKSNDILMA